jgi:hypothetical protein
MLFEVILRQSYFGRSILNRWHYNGSGTPAAVSMSFALASAFGAIPSIIDGNFEDGTVLGEMFSVQNESLVYQELQVEALYDVTEFYTTPYPTSQNGSQGGEPMSPFIAYPFRTNRIRTDIRRGFKRICGVSNQYTGDAGVIDGGMPALLDNLATAMSETLEYDDEGNTLTFQPCVLSLELITPVTNPRKYKLYDTEAEQLDHTALGVVFTAGSFVTTQNSRKD